MAVTLKISESASITLNILRRRQIARASEMQRTNDIGTRPGNVRFVSFRMRKV